MGNYREGGCRMAQMCVSCKAGRFMFSQLAVVRAMRRYGSSYNHRAVVVPYVCFAVSIVSSNKMFGQFVA